MGLCISTATFADTPPGAASLKGATALDTKQLRAGPPWALPSTSNNGQLSEGRVDWTGGISSQLVMCKRFDTKKEQWVFDTEALPLGARLPGAALGCHAPRAQPALLMQLLRCPAPCRCV